MDDAVMTEVHIKEIIEDVRARLSQKTRERALDWDISDQGYKVEEDWLYLCVTPTRKGIRVYDYAEILGEVEKELRKDGVNKVLLVPTLDD